jgi:cytochrome o ubiquinol oxidase operon protein cyoD
MNTSQSVEFGNLKSYLLGFFLSLILTLAAYYTATLHLFSGWLFDIVIASLAIVQALLQLFLFFNLTREVKPRWNLIIFLFMIMVVVIIVAGSIWIMNNLNYNLMPT